jgi:hypothetical protein
LIGTGWADFRSVSAWLGTFFPVRTNGDLLWYLYRDWGTGAWYPPSTPNADDGSWSFYSAARIGTGFAGPGCGFRDVSLAGLGRVYAVDGNTYLRHMYYTDYQLPYTPLIWVPGTPCGWAYGPDW